MKIKNKTLRNVVYYTLFPFVVMWFGLSWLIMKLGHYLYVGGNWMSGYRWDPYQWTAEV